eukprot:GHVU01195597.1.p2 GENE.GHVU01195597.1~~GHVU01195597.1.p2  ORF type:complete len:154 (-),score=24.34 GHVU01195597.1:19-480(-)
MAETALRDEGRTLEERAHRMAVAAELMGQAARRAEAAGEVIKDYKGSGHGYRGEVNKTGQPSQVFSGQVWNGRPDGLGVIRLGDGSVEFEGLWRNGELHELAVWRYPNGNIYYAGQYLSGRQHGLGVYRNEDGIVMHPGWWNLGVESDAAPQF